MPGPAHPSGIASIPDAYYAAWCSRDPERFAAVLTDDFTLGDPAFGAPRSGAGATLGFVTAAWTAYPDLHIERVGEPLVDAAGGRVACGWRLTGTHAGEGVPPGVPATGKRIEVTGVDIFTVSGERAAALTGHYDVIGLARQLGLAH